MPIKISKSLRPRKRRRQVEMRDAIARSPISDSRQLHPRRIDGTVVDATFQLDRVPVFEITFHHRAGARGSDRSVNADYHEGLELILERLSGLRATILGILVDSTVARELPETQRELELPFPIELGPSTDAGELRLTITRAQRSIARRAGVQPGGGNDQKRLKLTVAFDARDVTSDRLTAALVTRTSDAVRRRRRLPTVRELQDFGVLQAGMVLEANVGGRIWQAILRPDGRVDLPGSAHPRRLGLLTNEITGHSESSMRTWSVHMPEGLVPLSTLRDRLAGDPRWGM